ncbi:DUF1176 domain-containing protein [Sphingomonas sp. HITSZ_GF]|uniref:DUF1176 domain-containing protein n=1 Tax=Sphingomonas sp. HITSZ_GF TaxID=3037247 RepID=UPI00240D19FF|nr:DUF1176 domain-containing protein [Sphingomonas sp. HITSZ_GF]MDG2534553.1 DUF1176 domain-containing protein [Sphingomonas sp. HITSZ_GF]
MLALLLAAPAAQDDPEKTYGDWVVACDNLNGCEMTSLQPGEQPVPEDDSAWDASMSVTRAAGPAGGFTVEVWAAAAPSGKVTLRIDDAAIAAAAAGGESVTFTGADAARIVAAMPNGKALTLVDGSGKVAARISLAGSSASLRHIDANQGRAGTVTAIVAKGSKPASAVPAAKAPAQIAALRPSGTPATVSKAMRAGMERQSECDGLYDGAESVPEVESFALGGGKTLALLPCGAGAYNFSSVAFVLAGSKAVRAVFDDGNDGMLVNAGFDKGVLSSYNKGRGIGDCGGSQTYVWDGTRFRLTEARVMGECRGSTNWLATYRATPVFR